MEGSSLKTISPELKKDLLGTLETMLPNTRNPNHNHHHQPKNLRKHQDNGTPYVNPTEDMQKKDHIK